MRVVAYTRVSSEVQASDGVSLPAQREKLNLYCELHGLDLVELVTDAGASAKTLDRPGLARVLSLLDSGDATGLIVFKLDRLTRSLGDWSALIDRYFGEKGGRSLMSVSESIDTRTAAGRMVLNLMMTVAQWERETIVERTRGAMAFKRSRGERISGRIPYGHDLAEDGRALVENPLEQSILDAIRAMHAEGLTSGAIARGLNRSGSRAKLGGDWSASTVRGLLRRRGPRPA